MWVPTYWLTDNERTVTIDHVAGVAVRHPLIVEVGHHYRGHDRHLRAGRPRNQGRLAFVLAARLPLRPRRAEPTVVTVPIPA
jgi:transposase